MRRACALLMLMLMLLLTGAAPGPVRTLDDALPRPAIVLLWADWCAPCRREVDMLPALTATAAPTPVIVVAVDATPRSAMLLAQVPDRQKRLFAGSATVLFDAWGVRAAGLPVSVARDADGRTCAWHGGLLDSAAAARLAHCG